MTDRETNDPRTIPTEQLLQQTADPTSPGVYVLKLDSPDVTLGPEALHAHARWWYQQYQSVHPDDVAALAQSQRLLYVGATGNLQARLEDHVQADVRRSAWLSVYPPVELALVSTMPSADRAFELESQTAYRVNAMTADSTTVICDGEVIG